MSTFNREDRLVVARFGMSPDCTRFVSGRFYLNDSGLTVAPKNDLLVQRFLDYQLFALNDAIYGFGSGTAQRNLDVPAFRKMVIRFPESLSEQQRIVQLLDEAFDGIAIAKANAEKNLQNAQALFESRLRTLFTHGGAGWARGKLSDLIEIQNGYAFSSNNYVQSGHFLMRIGNVQNGCISVADPKYVKLPATGSLQRFNLAAGDILVSLTGNVGRIGVIEENHLPAALNQRVARIQVKSAAPVLSSLILHFLSSAMFRMALTNVGHGTAQQNVSAKEIGNIEIPLPDLEVQESLVQELDELQANTRLLACTYSNKLASLADLSKALLAQAFSETLAAA